LKILVISDEIAPALYEHFTKDRFQDVELVISCGDLSGHYLEFIISMLNVPCYYVPGNHDEKFVDNPPPGWVPLDDKLICHQGVSILGLGGSRKYKSGPFQYSDSEMTRRVLRIKLGLWLKKKTIDIFVTHAPAYDIGDIKNSPHQGFKAFRDILDGYQPKFFLHGHVHLNYTRHPRQMSYGKTKVINGYQYHVFDY
jgi:Icc-related predicted phosphoesterase